MHSVARRIYLVYRIEDCVRRRVKKDDSDLRVIATYFIKGYDGVGGVLTYRGLQKRRLEEHKELEEIIPKALLVAQDPEVYQLDPKGYILDRSAPEVLVLRRDDGMRTGGGEIDKIYFDRKLPEGVREGPGREVGERGRKASSPLIIFYGRAHQRRNDGPTSPGQVWAPDLTRPPGDDVGVGFLTPGT